MTISSRPNGQSTIEKQLYDFAYYIHNFYGVVDPLYPLVKETDGSALTTSDIYSAIDFYLKKISACTDGAYSWGDGDSIDRECVRDILTAHYGYVFAGGKN